MILPLLNEIEHTEAVITGIHRQLADRPHTILVIDDGSTDGTVEKVRELQQRFPGCVELIQRRKTLPGCQRGSALQAGLRWGLEHSDHELFVEMDGDLSHRVEELPVGLELVESGACDVAIASKYQPGSRVIGREWGRELVSYVNSMIVGFLIDSKIEDYSNGYRFYSRRAAAELARHRCSYGSPIYLTEALAIWLRAGFRIKEFPSTYVGREKGRSKVIVRDYLKGLLASLEIALRYHLLGFARLDGEERLGAVQIRPQRILGKLMLYLAAMTAVISLVNHLWPSGGQMRLFAPVWFELTQGRLLDPLAGGGPLVAYPPVYYWLVARLCGLGLGVTPAFALPVVLAVWLNLVFVFAGVFAAPLKAALALAVVGAALSLPGVPGWMGTPGLLVALVWFAALVCLESSRLEGWNTRKLLVGGVLLGLAGALDYPAWWALVGVGVPLAWLAYDLGLVNASKRAAFLGGGILLVWVPYLAGFVIPQWSRIREAVWPALKEGGWAAESLGRGLSLFVPSLPDPASLPLASFVGILQGWGAVLSLAAAGLLLLWRDTRGLFLVGLPLVLAGLGQDPTATPERLLPLHLLGLAGVAGLAFWALHAVLERQRYLFLRHYAIVLVCLVAAAVSWGNSTFRHVGFGPGTWPEGMRLMRAVGQELLGPGGRALGGKPLWYTGGARYWYDLAGVPLGVVGDLTTRGAVVLLGEARPHTRLGARTAYLLEQWQARRLRMVGFMLTQRPSAFSYLALGREERSGTRGKGGSGPRGFVWRGGAVFRFQSHQQGDQALVRIIHRAPLPRSLEADYRLTLPAGDASCSLVLFPRERVAPLRKEMGGGARIELLAVGHLLGVEAEELLRRGEGGDRVEFSRRSGGRSASGAGPGEKGS